MPTLTQLQNDVTAAKTKLDELIPKWNNAIQLYINYRDQYIVHLFCVNKSTQASRVITSGADWDAIALSIADYSDIGKIKKSANLPSSGFCNADEKPYGNSPATSNVVGALQYIEPFLVSFRALYLDLMDKYGAYVNALEALKESPEYAGSVLAQQETAEAEGKQKLLKWIFLGFSILIIAGAAWWMIAKTAFKKKFIIGGALAAATGIYLLFFGFKKSE